VYWGQVSTSDRQLHQSDAWTLAGAGAMVQHGGRQPAPVTHQAAVNCQHGIEAAAPCCSVVSPVAHGRPPPQLSDAGDWGLRQAGGGVHGPCNVVICAPAVLGSLFSQRLHAACWLGSR
jgi:hypothetical protein